MAKCGMKMPHEVAILIAEKSRHSRREVVADPENLGSLAVVPVCPTSPSFRYAYLIVSPGRSLNGRPVALVLFSCFNPKTLKQKPLDPRFKHSGTTDRRRRARPDLDPGSRAYREDDEVRHTGKTIRGKCLKF